MKFSLILIISITLVLSGRAQDMKSSSPIPGYEYRIKKYIDSLRVIDTHEHLFTPEIVKGSDFADFMLFFQPNGYDDLISAGMPGNLFDSLYNQPLAPIKKWRIIEPYWNNSFNTSFNRVILKSINSIYGIDDLNASTVGLISKKVLNTYSTDYFDHILRDSCKIDFIIQDGYYQPGKDDYFRYAKRFDDWLLIKSKFRIDSLAIAQLDPIYTLEDYVKSLRDKFAAESKRGMSVVKIFIAYSRTLSYEKVEVEAARKAFRSLIVGNYDKVLSFADAKPLQDYMFYQLLKLAEEYRLPVAFHTGIQSGGGNFINNSDPTLLVPVFKEFPNVNFVLFHGSYPFGGGLSVLSKTYKNVYVDMNWTWAISPSYSERYLNEWLETVPVSKIMGFGGDQMVAENVYSELLTAKSIISKVLAEKVRDGYFSEKEAKTVARMILYDNAVKFYKLH